MFGIFRKKPAPPPAKAPPVPCAVLADAVNERGVFLIKKVRRLTATYQVRLLAFKCTQENKPLVLLVPRECVFEDSLQRLMQICPVIVREEMP